ncbi:wax ester synthase/diacylglycerol acyltransferase 11-like [Humulus lupulus]|uniref:wax ester synthase/diacylglycerol acyltransferase 11-like n=1 Tax=Humulus lupulus TaxID=3486 RepID=UPI002B410756|nr:wax ester synthase/diacylglycerol acyltransferase 11-like [Humulus lupulus]
MEFEEGIRSRKQVLKPIKTKVENRGKKDEGYYWDDDKKTLLEEPVSPAGRLFCEPNFNVHILAIMGIKIKIDLEYAKQKLVQTLLKHPRFSSLQVVDENGGKMKWVRTEVDIERHVIVPKIEPNMEINPDKLVENYIYELTKTNLLVDRSKPLWEMHILNLKTNDEEGVVVFRIHHSLGDGTSLVSLLLACTRQIDNPEAVPTLPPKKPKEICARSSSNNNVNVNGFISEFSLYYRFLIQGLWWVLQLLWNTVVDVFLFLATAFFFKDTLRGPPGSEHNPRRIVFRIVSLDDIKLVKNAMNSTVNDVAMGITQAGLSRYFNKKYGENGKDFPTMKIRLRSNLIVNVRPSPGIQSLADMMEKNSKAKWGNWIGYVLLTFTIGLYDDPLDYIRKAKATIDRKKHSLEALCTFSISRIIFAIFGVKITSALFHKIHCNTTMVFSNVVGPLEKIGFYGHPMSYIAATTYGQPNELMVNFQSYVNKMTIVLSVDEATIPDPHQLCDDIVESLILMKNAVIEKGLLK